MAAASEWLQSSDSRLSFAVSFNSLAPLTRFYSTDGKAGARMFQPSGSRCRSGKTR